MDLHQGFRDPWRTPAGELARFLEAADRLPGFRAVRHALREALHPRPGMRLLDAGCGIGLEAARLAADFPETHITGLDRNAELLEFARERSADVEWVESDVADVSGVFDAVRTERVLMYVPDLDRAVDALVSTLDPGGRVAFFELDYGAAILAPGGASNAVMERAHEALRDSLPQPLAARTIPGLLSERGLQNVEATPFAVSAPEPIWRRIVSDTLSTLDAELDAWLRERDEAAARGEFVASFTGVLTTAST